MTLQYYKRLRSEYNMCTQWSLRDIVNNNLAYCEGGYNYITTTGVYMLHDSMQGNPYQPVSLIYVVYIRGVHVLAYYFLYIYTFPFPRVHYIVVNTTKKRQICRKQCTQYANNTLSVKYMCNYIYLFKHNIVTRRNALTVALLLHLSGNYMHGVKIKTTNTKYTVKYVHKIFEEGITALLNKTIMV